jgi:AcrR family transcriptional regulator
MKAVAKKPGRPTDERLWLRRHEEILDAAAKLFAKHGYSQTDTQFLADNLQVGKGTLYRYFPSKKELFLAAVDRVMRKLSERVDASIAHLDDPLERIEEGIKTFLSFLAENPEFVELLIQERAQFKDRKKPTYFEHRERRVEKWKELYRGLIREGRVRQMPVERITDVISDLLYGTMFTNHFAGPRKSFADQARDILDVVFNGILSDSERGRRSTEGSAR